MDGSRAQGHPGGALRSSVAWALLGLVIERPGYGYELMRRFGRTYGDALALTSAKQFYNALESLRARSLIEEIDASHVELTPTRQPRPHYRVTEEGRRSYEEWLLAEMEEQRHRSRLFARQLAMLEPDAALEVLDEYEREWLTSAGEATPAETTREALAARLVESEEQTTLEVRIAWIEYARNELKALIAERGEETAGG
jgi:DNA-binding PadR family transcriptional regulator